MFEGEDYIGFSWYTVDVRRVEAACRCGVPLMNKNTISRFFVVSQGEETCCKDTECVCPTNNSINMKIYIFCQNIFFGVILKQFLQ